MAEEWVWRWIMMLMMAANGRGTTQLIEPYPNYAESIAADFMFLLSDVFKLSAGPLRIFCDAWRRQSTENNWKPLGSVSIPQSTYCLDLQFVPAAEAIVAVVWLASLIVWILLLLYSFTRSNVFYFPSENITSASVRFQLHWVSW